MAEGSGQEGQRPQPFIHDDKPESIIPKHGGYKTLVTFQLAALIYDVTVRFCNRNIPIASRTHDQMVQAARSGVQNIVEGSMVSGTSKKIEMKLTGIAIGSLEELRRDYMDFLRHRELKIWRDNDPRRYTLVARRCKTADEVAAWVKETHRAYHDNTTTPPPISSSKSIPSIKSIYAETAANAALVLIGVTIALLDRQLKAQGAAFEKEGGFTERLYRVRNKRRGQQ